MTFFAELKRRNVFRVGLAYLLGAWVLLQIVDFVLEVIAAPDWILQVFVLAAAVGLPVVLIFSWVFEMTPEGVKRESEIDRSQSITPTTGRKLDRVIIVFLAVAVVILLADKFVVSDARGPVTAAMEKASEKRAQTMDTATITEPARREVTASSSRKSIAVLPFLALSSGEDDGYFADGLTEEILNSPARLPELLVTSRTSAFHFKGKDVPIQEIAETLGVEHVVEGSVRRSGDRLRVTAQLIRARDGFHLWSENYDSTSQDTISVQEDIAEKIAVAMDVVLNDEKRENMRKAGLRDVEAFIAYQKGQEAYDQAHGQANIIELLQEANRYYETVIERVPSYTPAYPNHSDMYVHILLDDASGQNSADLTEQEIDEALGHIVNDYQRALETADSLEVRNNIELDLAFLTSNWRGMSSRVERFLASTGCIDFGWGDFVALNFGYAEKLAVRLNELRQCDPMYSQRWMVEARALLVAGDHTSAIEVAEAGSKIVPSPWLSIVLIRAYAATRQYETAINELVRRVSDEFGIVTHQLMIAAMKGDKPEAMRLLEQYRGLPQSGRFFDLILAAWVGDRDTVNEKAAEMDRHPFRAPGLLTVITWCMCGAPWDIEFTPNFQAALQDSGLSWPPVDSLKFPMKDW